MQRKLFGRRRAASADQRSALILGSYVTALHATRSLSRAGLHVILGSGTEYSTVPYSRHCGEVFSHPSIDDEEAFLEALLGFIRARPDIAVIVPLMPKYISCLARNRDRLPADPVIAMPDPAVVLWCLDKGRILALARELDVPLRPSLVVDDMEALEAAASTVGFPLVVKSVGDDHGTLPGGRKAVVARDARELRQGIPRWPDGHPAVVVQPYVSGVRYNLNFAARDGRILMCFNSLAVRTSREDGTGSGVEWVLPPVDERLLRATQAMVGRLGYTGVGNTQWMVSERGDEPHLLELNPRIAMPAQMSASCGFDTVLAACQLAGCDVGWREDLAYSYPVGRRAAWVSRDAFGLLTAIGSHDIRPRAAARWALAILGSAVRADIHLTWAWDDPVPSIVAWAHILRPGSWLVRGTGLTARDRVAPRSDAQ